MCNKKTLTNCGSFLLEIIYRRLLFKVEIRLNFYLVKPAVYQLLTDGLSDQPVIFLFTATTE